MKKMRDVQALRVVDCSRGGYQPRLAGFREAGFASTDEEGAPVLRVLRPSGH
jgi:hypothetical protein